MKIIVYIFWFYVAVCYGIYIQMHEVPPGTARWDVLMNTPKIITLSFLDEYEADLNHPPAPTQSDNTIIHYRTEE